MTQEQKVQMVAETIARENDNIEEVKQDVRGWPGREVEMFIYKEFQV